MNRFNVIAALAFALYATTGIAHESHHATRINYSTATETPFGRAADPHKAQRTVRIEMSDRMRFSPAEIVVKRGEIIRFVPVNTGKMLHEMVIGTTAELKVHAEMMRKMPGMKHSEPHMAHVAPGSSGEIGWQFTRAGEFQFACLLPGHFEAGMVGKVRVLP